MGRFSEDCFYPMSWRSLLVMALFWLAASTGTVRAAESLPGTGRPTYQVKLTQAYDLMASSPFVYGEGEIDRYGEAALALSSDTRLYALWRVLYAYKDSQNEAKLRYWHDRIMKEAQRDGDSDLDLLARFMVQAYENEASHFTLLTEREWSTYLDAPNRVIRNVVALERQRRAQFGRQWAEAIDLGEALVIRLEGDGKDAQALLSVAQQTLAYNMLMVGDHDSYADHMLAVAKLARSNAFFSQKMSYVYDLAYFVALNGDIGLARKLQSLYASNIKKYRLTELQSWDQELCAMVAERGDDYRTVIRCLSESNAATAEASTFRDAVQLMTLINAYAQIGDVKNTKKFYEKLKQIPANVFVGSPLFDRYVDAYLTAGAGDYKSGFRKLGDYTTQSNRVADHARIAGIQDMYQALRKELDSKTQESRLLVKQVQMQRLLLGAAALIAILLVIMVVGGAFWALRMRRLHRNLNEAHDHAEAANAAKSRFLAVMSHELRTPLNGILGMAQALKKDNLSSVQREQVDILVDSGETLLALLNDVLDMSRIEAGKIELAPTPASMKDMVDRVVNTYTSLLGNKHVALRYDLDESAEKLMSFDVLRVYQCLSNLVSNAIKFTDNGSVNIRVSATLDNGSHLVRCEVRDTGIGMNKAVVDKLFEAYSQADVMTVRKYGGSGLGLSISRRLAELMGGSLSVTSEEGRGSTFVMTFRAGMVADTAPAAEAPSASMLAEEDESLPGLHILLVDDHPVNRKVARLFLEPFGFVITEAGDGQEALDLDMSRFDLVLMDLNMPKVGGLEATRLFRASEAPGRHVPIVALTADAMHDQIAACLAAGMDAHIAKPIIMDTLIETVARLLHIQDEAAPAAKSA